MNGYEIVNQMLNEGWGGTLAAGTKKFMGKAKNILGVKPVSPIKNRMRRFEFPKPIRTGASLSIKNKMRRI